MEETTLVSIRCLVYNHEPYLRQCLDGFVMQKTSFPFEAIVHDDASTDGSAAIIREYAEKYPNIIKPIFEKENQYSKRDGSLREIVDNACHGKYYAICEGDDYWIDPNKLQKQVDFLEKNENYLMVCNATKLFSHVHNEFQGVLRCYDQSKDVEVEDIVLQGGGFVPTCSILYRPILRYNYPDYCSQCHVGDWPMQIMSVLKGQAYYFDDIMSVYRVENNTSWTGRNQNISFEKKLRNIKSEVDMLYGFMKDYSNYKQPFKEKISRIVISNTPVLLKGRKDYFRYRSVFKKEIESFSKLERKQFLKNSSAVWVFIIRKLILFLKSFSIK